MNRTPFRGPSNILLTASLFFDITDFKKRDTSRCLFSFLSSSDPRFPDHLDQTLISVYDTYLELEDITGFKWAKQYLEDYDHFTTLMELSWFKDEMTKLNREILSKRQSEAFETLLGLVSDEDATAAVRLSSAKYVMEEGWKKNTGGSKRGRPSKTEVEGELKRRARAMTELEQDAKRAGIALKVVGGTEGHG